MSDNAEGRRLQAAHDESVAWRKWGPYLSERQWGTVREDYSDDWARGVRTARLIQMVGHLGATELPEAGKHSSAHYQRVAKAGA